MGFSIRAVESVTTLENYFEETKSQFQI